MATPEEIQKLKEEQRRRIAEKEAAGVQVGGAGMAGEPGEVVKRDSVGTTPTGRPVLNVPGEDVKVERVAQQPTTVPESTLQVERDVKASGLLEQEGFFEETRPGRTELDIERRGVEENIPVLGPSLSALGSVLRDIVKDTPVEGARGKRRREEETQALMQDPETIREVAIQEIQKKTIQEGISASEQFGSLIESIPVIGGLASKYANGLIETPRGNAETIRNEIKKMGTIGTNMREKALAGKMGDPYVAFAQLQQMEIDVAKMEQRIKLLSLSSPILIADADTLNAIETDIVDSKQRIFDAKQAAAAGLRQVPSDASIYQTLKELEGGTNNG